MKISGLSCITKKIFLVFLGHPNGQCNLSTNAVSRQKRVCLGSSLSMSSFAIDEAPSPLRALYAILLQNVLLADKYQIQVKKQRR